MKINWPRIYKNKDQECMWPRHGLFIVKNEYYTDYFFVLKFPFTGWVSANYASFRVLEHLYDEISGETTYKVTNKRKRSLRFNGSFKSGQ